MSARVLVEDDNVWRTRRANRVAFLVDGRAYYDAFLAALAKAQRSVLILSWDIDSQVRLQPGGPRLLEVLNATVVAKPELHIHILNWDYAALYTFERENIPRLKFDLHTHERVHFELDNARPPLASHHQKIVVIDDMIAFSGGIDLTTSRWDTPEHRPVDERRAGRDGKLYGPFHDVQMTVDGEAAKSLGDLARARWQAATGRKMLPPDITSDPWPEGVEPDVRDVDVSIARTMPAYRDQPVVHEVERSYVDMIRSAKRYIYAETQYLTGEVIARELARRALEPGGPEVVLVAPRECSGWTEKQTMGVITARLVRDFEARADKGRLKICAPLVEKTPIFVHAKVMVVDDSIVRVGSANLSNRSMGVDTECDLMIEDGRAARALLHRLLGEHLGVTPEVVAKTREEHSSLIASIDALSGGPRTLGASCVDGADETLLVPPNVCDPMVPMGAESLIARVLPMDQAVAARTPMLRVAAAIAFLIALALSWRLTPLSTLIDLQRLVEIGADLAHTSFAPILVMLVFTVATLLMVPVNLLILATGMIFGPLWGVLYAFLGALSGAASGYSVGQVIGARAVESRMGRRAKRLHEVLDQRGIVSFAFLRMVPIASFGLVNMFAGAVRLRFHHFMIGTALGMAPGIIAAAVFGGELADVFLRADRTQLVKLVGLGIVGLATIGLAMRWVARRIAAKRAAHVQEVLAS